MNKDIPDSILYGIAAKNITDEQFDEFINKIDRDQLAVVFNDIRRAMYDHFFKTEEEKRPWVGRLHKVDVMLEKMDQEIAERELAEEEAEEDRSR